MDILILDEQLRYIDIYDRHISFIWTERYSAFGDFELVCRNDKRARTTFVRGTKFAIQQSERVMIVRTIEKDKNEDGSNILKITGYSILRTLADRPGMQKPYSALDTVPKWSFSVTPSEAVKTMFWQVCTDEDAIEWVSTTDLATGNIPFPTDVPSIQLDPADLYTQIKKVCDTYLMGFDLIRPKGTTNELRFGPYMGDDRTLTQSEKPPVVFSAELDSLKDIKSIVSDANYYNVAYVFGKYGFAEVYADNIDPSISGVDRRVLTVTASDIDLPAGAALTLALEQRGREELAQHRTDVAFDGEIPQNNTAYTYGVDYNLGDLVDLQDSDGTINHMVVTEQIFVSDKEGDRSYPTLTFYEIVTPGTWLAVNAAQRWIDATGTWSEN